MNRIVRVACALALATSLLAVAGCHRPSLSALRSLTTFGSHASTQAVAVSTTPTGSAAASITTALESLPSVGDWPRWAKSRFGVVNGVRTNRKVVALTFDDGPTEHTRALVDTLDRYGAHATFFWVGSRITTAPATYSIAHGEELANHTWTHPNMKTVDSAEASEEIGWTSARIAEFTGAPPIWFRGPYNRLYSAEHLQVEQHHLLYANYDITSLDWLPDSTSDSISSDIARDLHPGGIILMHDSPHHDPLAYLPRVLAYIKSRGYQMVTLSTLAPMGPPDLYPLKRYHAALSKGQDNSGQ